MSKKPTADAFQTIDPTALNNVSGGSSRGDSGGSDQLSAALSSIQESLSSLASNRSQGPDMMQLCMFMMAMNSQPQQQTVAAGPAVTAWNWENGNWTPTY